ncbi:hypothetical protein SAMN05421743_11220 [Thalassobacillus cyri]|uniref:Uncharacterized protein n=1 Tax=Thalassobacillus cyri TaxID=571932 RepID=A0A1H4FNK6_9BACI|nr:hypothetical protein [Thalassobacillus cyri]SEA98667.1 hypothetical protein SAMN05421743_11220 [Thalassobacillus cyri]
MSQQYLTIEEFNQLLQEWNGERIKIAKQELADHDSISMHLDSISYSKDTRRIDGYEPMHTIQLNGSGQIETDGDGFQPLPDSYYEIPLEDTTKYQFDENTFTLVTERGIYTIEIAGEQ